jgi:hypothetical protein
LWIKSKSKGATLFAKIEFIKLLLMMCVKRFFNNQPGYNFGFLMEPTPPDQIPAPVRLQLHAPAAHQRRQVYFIEGHYSSGLYIAIQLG